MVWREPRDHITDCYFCLTCVSGFSAKSRHLIQYPNLDSAIRPVLYADDDTRPVFFELASLESDGECSNVHDVAEQSSERNSDSDFELLSTELQTFSQAELVYGALDKLTSGGFVSVDGRGFHKNHQFWECLADQEDKETEAHVTLLESVLG
ncbi:hypothetical protein RRG08_011300 [Elysia crispata]|uniref:Uncharacterized protein n=1 Tax=Elysia crispata TaxID=231223 RepID=A0AAE0YF62_9GAST|nr:hypothetical protein RRG08_011300 [Elysia crispata]